MSEWPLTGRAKEHSTIAALTRAGRPGVVLAGPAGVGKTRLLREIAAAAGGSSVAVAATRTTAAIPLGAFAPVLPARPDRSPLEVDLLRWAADAILTATPRPKLLAVDDGHALDDTSAALVGLLAAAGLTVAITVRTGDRAPDAVTALWKDGAIPRVEVGPLAADDVDALLVAVLGGAVEGRTRAQLWGASQGNPLYLRELVLGALDSGLLAATDGVWRLTRPLAASPRLHELVEARLVDLGDEDRATADLVAVAEPVDVPLLLSLAPLESVERLEAGGHLVVGPDGIRFAHPLHGEVVRERMPALRRMAISRRLAEAVTSSGAEADVLRLARWQLDGGSPPEPAALVAAAAAAFAAHDRELADRLADAAVAAGGGVPARLLRIQVLGALGRFEEQAEAFPALLADAGDDTERAMVAKAWGETMFWDLGQPERADEVLAAVADGLDAEGWRQDVNAQRGTFRLLSGDVDGALDTVAPYLGPEVRRIAHANASMVAIHCLAYQGRGAVGTAVAAAALGRHEGGTAEQVGTDPAHIGIAAVNAAIEALALGRALELATVGYDRAVSAGDANTQAWYALMVGSVHLAAGRVASADRWFRESGAVFGILGTSTAPQRRTALAGRIIATALLGHRDTAAALVAELDGVSVHTVRVMEPDTLRARGWAAWSAGDRREATRSFIAAVALADTFGARNLAASALHDAVRLGLAAAAPAAAALERLAADPDGLLALRAAHVRALAARDADALLALSTRARDAGATLVAAESAAAAAGLCRRAGHPRAADNAGRRARQLADACEGARPPGIDQAGEGATLTTRERQVAELAAAGRTSKAIAEELVVSIRTVDNLLARVYAKLGIAGRAELADALDPR